MLGPQDVSFDYMARHAHAVGDIIRAHPDVADAGVFARADPEWGEAVVAAVVARDGVGLEASELTAWCRERLAAFKVPKAFELRAQLPRTETGKLLRRELRG